MIDTVDRGLLKLSNTLVMCVTDYMLTLPKYKTITKTRRTLVKKAVNCFIHNTFTTYCSGRKRSQITLDQNHFGTGGIVNGVKLKPRVSYTYTKLVLSALEDSGYVVLVVGGRTYEWDLKTRQIVSVDTCSYLEYQTKLQILYNNYKPEYKVKLLRNIYELRDEEKKPKVYKTTSEIKLEKENVYDYNNLTLTQDVSDNKDRVYNCQIKKIFNIDFKTGGKSFMTDNGIQHLSKKERMDLMINNNETVIYDYKAFEPSIAYSINQELMKDDPYMVEWDLYDKDTLRTLGKMALTTMLYASNKREAVGALNYEISQDLDVDQLYEEGLIPKPCIPVKELIDELEEKNKVIKNLLYNNVEHNLSNIGSKIMDFIINYFTQRSILVLPVFDEVIIEMDHEDKLKEVMEMAYQSVLGFTDNCTIVKEK